MKTFLMGLCIVLSSWTFGTQAGRITNVNMWPVDTLTSIEGEGKEEFLLRAGKIAADWTSETGYETCAFVATDGQGKWGLRLLTLKSQVDCVFAFGQAPEGMTTTNETFHTHPTPTRAGFIDLDENTKAAAKAMGDRVTAEAHSVAMLNDGEFSEADRGAGHGYLVTNGVLMYQNGPSKSNTKTVGKIN